VTTIVPIGTPLDGRDRSLRGHLEGLIAVPAPSAEAYRGRVDHEPSGDDGVTDDPEVGTESQHAAERPVDKFRKTAAGTVVAAGLLGLRNALEGRPEREEIAIVNEAPTRPTAGPTLVFDEDTGTVTVTLPATLDDPA
jgi:hypothetical protein